MSDVKTRLIEKFRVLAQERLAKLDNALVRLEAEPNDAELVRETQREIHTLKGEARIVGLAVVNAAAHHTEDLLHEACRQNFSRRDVIDAVLRGFDLLRDVVKADAPDAAARVDAFIAATRVLVTPGGAPAVAAAPATPAPQPVAEKREQPAERGKAVASEVTIRVPLPKLELLPAVTSELQLNLSALQRTLVILEGKNRALSAQLAKQVAGGMSEQSTRRAHELEHGVGQLLTSAKEQLLDARVQLERLQLGVRDLAMQPLATLFERYPRVVRDLASELGKLVRLEVSGADIELDKRVLDHLDEPLLHLIRNAIDHGVEAPEVRRRRGKSETACIRLTARLSGSRVELEMTDDGGGVNVAGVRQVAVERRLLSPEGADSTSDDDVLNLLFSPGFTTRREVTEVSGRGIGLDIVKQRLAALGGAVGVTTLAGEGTRFHLSVPTTITLTRMLIVEAADRRFAFPVDDVVSLAMVAPSEIERAGEGDVARIGDDLVPLADLATLMAPEEGSALPSVSRPVVVLAAGTQRFGFFVDRLLGDRQLIQKPLGALLEGAPLLRSTAVLDTGEVAIGLDLQALLVAAGSAVRVAERRATTAPSQRRRVLVVEDSELTRDLVVSLLREHGYEVIEAVNGRDALVRMAEHTPDLVLTDLQMPVLDGFGLLREVRGSSRWRTLPVVVLSTLGGEADRHQASNLGADAYLVKNDFQRDQILATVARFIGGRPDRGLS